MHQKVIKSGQFDHLIGKRLAIRMAASLTAPVNEQPDRRNRSARRRKNIREAISVAASGRTNDYAQITIVMHSANRTGW